MLSSCLEIEAQYMYSSIVTTESRSSLAAGIVSDSEDNMPGSSLSCATVAAKGIAMIAEQEREMRDQIPPLRSVLSLAIYIAVSISRCAVALNASGRGAFRPRLQTRLHLDMVHQAYQGFR
jgi:hypothetical protein